MPYIKQINRIDVDEYLDPLISHLTRDYWRVDDTKHQHQMDGIVNYIMTKILKTVYPPSSYSSLNSAMGVLESAKQEFYRVVVAPYEDQKREENGDVYGEV